MAWGAIAGAVLGGLAGSQKDESRQGIDLTPASALEHQATSGMTRDYSQLSSMADQGPGQVDVGNALTANRSLADMLKQYAQGGFLPSESDWGTANKFAQQAFQGQQVGLQQQFQGQQQRASQLAAQLGRPVNDPIIQARLSQELMQGQERLGAAQGSYASQYAQQLPQQRLGYTAQLADVQNSLASQAMSNRQALLSLGSQVQGAERSFRLNTGTRWGESGGGLKGAITGGLAGAAGFMGIGNMMDGKAFDGGALNSGQNNASSAGSFMGGLLGSNTSFGNMQPNTGNYSAASSSMLPLQTVMPAFSQQAAPLSYMRGVGSPQFTPQFSPPAQMPQWNYPTGNPTTPAGYQGYQYNGGY